MSVQIIDDLINSDKMVRSFIKAREIGDNCNLLGNLINFELYACILLDNFVNFWEFNLIIGEKQKRSRYLLGGGKVGYTFYLNILMPVGQLCVFRKKTLIYFAAGTHWIRRYFIQTKAVSNCFDFKKRCDIFYPRDIVALLINLIRMHSSRMWTELCSRRH